MHQPETFRKKQNIKPTLQKQQKTILGGKCLTVFIHLSCTSYWFTNKNGDPLFMLYLIFLLLFGQAFPLSMASLQNLQHQAAE